MDQRITDAIEALGDARDLAENAGLELVAEEFARCVDQLRSVDRGLGPVYVLKGWPLADMLGTLSPGTGIYEVAVAIDGGLKIKINEGSWTPPMGALKE